MDLRYVMDLLVCRQGVRGGGGGFFFITGLSASFFWGIILFKQQSHSTWRLTSGILLPASNPLLMIAVQNSEKFSQTGNIKSTGNCDFVLEGKWYTEMFIPTRCFRTWTLKEHLSAIGSPSPSKACSYNMHHLRCCWKAFAQRTAACVEAN